MRSVQTRENAIQTLSMNRTFRRAYGFVGQFQYFDTVSRSVRSQPSMTPHPMVSAHSHGLCEHQAPSCQATAHNGPANTLHIPQPCVVRPLKHPLHSCKHHFPYTAPPRPDGLYRFDYRVRCSVSRTTAGSHGGKRRVKFGASSWGEGLSGFE